jgi:hypothetical protein
MSSPVRPSFLVALACLVLASAAVAGPRRCGDDADGRGTPVPCDCGDVLVSGRTLTDDDPITQHPCDGTGLVVDVRGDGSPVLALAGHTLVGNGHGIGIQVLRGGSGGLTITGPGAIRSFGTGVQAPTGALAAVTDVLAAENHRNGFEVNGVGYTITRCEAVKNGHLGFALRGRDYHADGNRALDNGRTGFALAGRNASVGDISGNEAVGNAGNGVTVRGRGHDVEHLTATANRRSGLRARFAKGRIADATAVGNQRQGIHASGDGLTVTDTVASGNGSSDDASGDGGDTHGRRCRTGKGCK